jgi:hypothetical protein
VCCENKTPHFLAGRDESDASSESSKGTASDISSEEELDDAHHAESDLEYNSDRDYSEDGEELVEL